MERSHHLPYVAATESCNPLNRYFGYIQNHAAIKFNDVVFCKLIFYDN